MAKLCLQGSKIHVTLSYLNKVNEVETFIGLSTIQLTKIESYSFSYALPTVPLDSFTLESKLIVLQIFEL